MIEVKVVLPGSYLVKGDAGAQGDGCLATLGLRETEDLYIAFGPHHTNRAGEYKGPRSTSSHPLIDKS